MCVPYGFTVGQYVSLIAFLIAAYVVGHLVQEVFSWIGLVKMGYLNFEGDSQSTKESKNNEDPNEIAKCRNSWVKPFLKLFCKKTGYEFNCEQVKKELETKDYIATRVRMNQFYSSSDLQGLERIISLQHVGSAIGSNGVVAGLISIWAMRCNGDITRSAWWWIAPLLIASIALLVQSRLMGMRKMMVMAALKEHMDKQQKNSMKSLVRNVIFHK